MISFLLSTWRSGLRSRSIQGILVLGVLLVGVAYLSAAFSPRQPRTVAMDVGISGVRIALVLFVLFWVQELVGREIERRTVLYALTYPVPRGSFVVGRYLGITGLLALAALLLGMLLWCVLLVSGGGYEQGYPVLLGMPYWLTIFGLWVDAAVVAAFALWIATVSTVPILPLALGMAFAIAGKSLGAVVDYLARGADGDAEIMRLAPILDAIQWVLPDLSRLDWRAWPMYGIPAELTTMAASVVMAVAYAAMLVTLAVAAFRHREFQ